MRLIDLTGRRFGSLTVLTRAAIKKNNHPAWWVTCDCSPTEAYVVAGVNLRTGSAFSCGCSQRKHGMSRSREWRAWRAMRQRCEERGTASSRYHGDAGIGYDPQWANFPDFLADMGECPPGCTLDRIDGHKGYCKDNCQWATKRVQGINQRKRNGCASKYHGVTRCRGRWLGYICHFGKTISFGTYATELQAAFAHNLGDFEAHGEGYVRLNHGCEWDSQIAAKVRAKLARRGLLGRGLAIPAMAS